jgi:hypothetical protein
VGRSYYQGPSFYPNGSWGVPVQSSQQYQSFSAPVTAVNQSAEWAGNDSILASTMLADMSLTKEAERRRLDLGDFQSGVDLKTFKYWEERFGTRTEGELNHLSSGQIVVVSNGNPQMYRVPSKSVVTQVVNHYAEVFARSCEDADSAKSEFCREVRAILDRYPHKRITAAPSTRTVSGPKAGPDPFFLEQPKERSSASGNKSETPLHAKENSGRSSEPAKDNYKSGQVEFTQAEP